MSKNKAKKEKLQKMAKAAASATPKSSAAAPVVAPEPQFLSPEEVPFAIEPPEPKRCLAPLYINADPQLVPDPWAVLQIPPGTTDEAAVRAAWRERLIESPPEQDPEGAARLTSARDRLLDPSRWAERALGTLHIPDPDAWNLPSHADLWDAGLIDARTRLLGQALLYALLEQDITK